jgi:GTPase SAR1 family protein
MEQRKVAPTLHSALDIVKSSLEKGDDLRSLASAGSSNAGKILSGQHSELSKGIFQLIVLGEFKNGKSTLLNSFLGEKILPAKQAPATAVITRIFHGSPDSGVTVYYADGKQKSLGLTEFQSEFMLDIADHGSHAEDRFRDILYADIPVDLDLCRDGVILVDSPGLAENPVRTKATQDFFKFSTGAILVLDATQPLSIEEVRWAKDLFSNFGPEGVFIVVNKINLVDDDEIDEIKSLFHARLREISNETLGREQQNRIYFVDARTALRSRTSGSEDLFRISGVYELLNDLSIFLSSSGRERIALKRLQTASNDFLNEHERLVNDWKAAASSSLEDLKARKAESQVRLENLKDKARQIEELFTEAGIIIADATYENLEQFIKERQSKWGEESIQGLPLTGVSAWDGFKAPFERLWGFLQGKGNDKAHIEKEIQKGIEIYINRILLDWAERLPSDLRIQAAVTKVRNSVDQGIKEISVDLESIKALFAGVRNADTEADINRITQAFIGVLMLDPSQVSGSILGNGNWQSFLTRFIIQVVITVVLGIFAWPIAIVYYVMQEYFHIANQVDGFADKMRKSIGEKMFPKILEELSIKRLDIKKQVSEKFAESGQSVRLQIVSEIQDVQDQQSEIVRNIEENSSKVWEQIKKSYALLDEIKSNTTSINDYVQL